MPFRDEVLADSPWAYWRFGEASGTVAQDETVNDRDGTYNNTPTLGVPGAVAGDTAVAFDAAQSEYVRSGAVFNSGVATLECWINVAAIPGNNQCIATCADGLNSPVFDKALWLGTDGFLRFYVYDGVEKTCVSTTAVPTGQWVHVAAVADGTNALIYQDGAQVGALAAGATYAGYTVANVFVAAPTPTPLGYFTGSVDEFAIYTTALSPTRVAAHHDAAAAVPQILRPDATLDVTGWTITGSTAHAALSDESDSTFISGTCA